MKMVEPQQTACAKQLKKTSESEPVKALYTLWYGLLLCRIGEELEETELCRW